MRLELRDNFSGCAVFRNWFIRYALLLPVVVMAGYFVGRGLGNFLQLLYVIGGLCTVKIMNFRPHKDVIYVFVLLLSIFLISVIYPDFSAKSLKYWILYALSGLVLLFTVGAYGKAVELIDFRSMAWVPVVLLVGLSVELGYFYLFAENFQPAVQVNGMILAALAPLFFFSVSSRKLFSYLFPGLFFSIALLLLVAADSRTEVLMLIVGGALFFTFKQKKISIFLGFIPLMLILPLVMDSLFFIGNDSLDVKDIYSWLDQLSSKRISIWYEALSHAPNNYMIGVGMNRSMEFLGQLDFVKHLHNLFIEIWYETGVLGLSAYFLLLLLLLRGVPNAYRKLQGMERRTYSIFLASGCAALVGAMLDKGYYHPLTRYYMLFCFTVLYLFHRWPVRGRFEEG